MWRLAAGARAVADFRFDDRIEGMASSALRSNPTRHHQDVISARTRNAFAGTTFDEPVQWMVQDASPDRCDR
jgi:hypothetical protein